MAAGGLLKQHYSDFIMGMMASQITSLTIVYSTVYSGTDHRKHQNLQVTGVRSENSPVTGEFPAKRYSNAENVFIWWHHHKDPEYKPHWYWPSLPWIFNFQNQKCDIIYLYFTLKKSAFAAGWWLLYRMWTLFFNKLVILITCPVIHISYSAWLLGRSSGPWLSDPRSWCTPGCHIGAWCWHIWILHHESLMKFNLCCSQHSCFRWLLWPMI